MGLEPERNAARLLKEASDVMAETPTALQLRYLQAMDAVGNKNATIVFPVPLQGVGTM